MSRFSVLAAVGSAMLIFTTSSARADRIVLVAGGGDKGDGASATEARLHQPFGVDFDKSGAMFIVELEGGHVHRVDAQGLFSTIAGTGEAKGDAGDGRPAKNATFNGMHSLAIAPSGEIYIADTWNNRVRTIDPKSGLISAFAGTGKKAYAGDGGPAAKADCGGIYCVAFGPDARTLYLADLDNRRIRAVDMQSGVIRLVAGNGERGVPADGSAAREAPLVDPRAVAADRDGNVYVLERGGHALRVVDRAGKIRTIAGTGKAGPAGDDGPALAATLRGPKHLCLDRDGNVIVADTDNHVIRKYLPKERKLVRVAGTGKAGSTGLGGPPEKVELNQPHGVHVDAAGTLFIVDSYNNRVLKIMK
jgi:DNA-binding beta-propeller fold protein YncE